MFKGQKGITLVALVITIIVLLILAGVTISLTLGNEGIITRAQQATGNYINAANEEKTQLNGVDKTTEQVLKNVFGE